MTMNNPILLADIGGTNARFAIFDDQKQPVVEKTYQVQDHPSLPQIVREFMEANNIVTKPVRAAFAVAGPVRGDTVTFTNSAWSFSKTDLANEFDFERLLIVNDFTANAYAIPTFGADELDVILQRPVDASHPSIIIGAGTGLGMATLPRQDAHPLQPMPTEAGHIALSPIGDRETAIESILDRNGIVPIMDNILSGKGLSNVHAAWREFMGHGWNPVSPVEISQRAHDEKDQDIYGDARQAFKIFAGIMGSFAAHMSLTTIPYGGVFLTGGVIQKNHDVIEWDYVAERFQTHKTMAALLKEIPMSRVIPTVPAFRGLLEALCTTNQLPNLAA